ncbi:hypothetical protein D3C75_1178430 [compost metagenome]
MKKPNAPVHGSPGFFGGVAGGEGGNGGLPMKKATFWISLLTTAPLRSSIPRQGFRLPVRNPSRAEAGSDGSVLLAS